MSQRKRILLTIAAATIAALIWIIGNGIADAGTKWFDNPDLDTSECNQFSDTKVGFQVFSDRESCIQSLDEYRLTAKDYDVAGMATSAAPVLLLAGLAVVLTLLWIKDDEPAE